VIVELKPCPFCGNIDDMRFTVRFKNDRRKVNGIYYKLCTLSCDCCTASVRQAGPTEEKAYINTVKLWNRRADDGQETQGTAG